MYITYTTFKIVTYKLYVYSLHIIKYYISCVLYGNYLEIII